VEIDDQTLRLKALGKDDTLIDHITMVTTKPPQKLASKANANASCSEGV